MTKRAQQERAVLQEWENDALPVLQKISNAFDRKCEALSEERYGAAYPYKGLDHYPYENDRCGVWLLTNEWSQMRQFNKLLSIDRKKIKSSHDYYKKNDRSFDLVYDLKNDLRFIDQPKTLSLAQSIRQLKDSEYFKSWKADLKPWYFTGMGVGHIMKEIGKKSGGDFSTLSKVDTDFVEAVVLFDQFITEWLDSGKYKPVFAAAANYASSLDDAQTKLAASRKSREHKHATNFAEKLAEQAKAKLSGLKPAQEKPAASPPDQSVSGGNENSLSQPKAEEPPPAASGLDHLKGTRRKIKEKGWERPDELNRQK